MAKAKVLVASKNRRAVRPKGPSLPLELKQIQIFLKKAQVPPDQEHDLEKARLAFNAMTRYFYGALYEIEPEIRCILDNPYVPPFF